MTSDIVVAILAGGAGERLGGEKPLRQLAGERLVDHALRAARLWSDVTLISVREPRQVEPVNALLITDQPGIGGPLAGLVSALRHGAASGRQFVLTIPADMPFLPMDLRDRLLAAIGDGGCALASSGGHLHPVCGLWRATAVGQVDTYLADKQRSLKAFAALIGFCEVRWPAGPNDPFFNINSPADLAEAERRIAA